MTSSLGSTLIFKVLVSTKSLHVHKSTKNDDIWSSDTLDTCTDDQCYNSKAKWQNSVSVLTVTVQFDITKALMRIIYWMVEFSTISLGCSKHTLGRHRWGTIKNIIALRKYGQIASPSTLCHCRYSMSEYTTKIHLFFNMCYIIQNFLKTNEYNKSHNRCRFIKFSHFSSKTAENPK